jgi:lysophospholipase L1-like esterase
MAFELPATANLVIHCNTDTVTLTDGKVSQWDDQSGNANHLTEANATYQPTLISRAGRKAIWFAGAHRLALPAGLTLRGDETTVLMVVSNYGLDNWRWWWSPNCKPQFGTYLRGLNYLDSTHHNSTIAAGQFALFGIRGNGAAADVICDMETETLALSATSSTTGGYVGAHTTGAANFGQFYLQALMVWNKTLTDAELLQAREYVAATYGIPAAAKNAVVVMTGDSTTRGFAATHSILQMLLSDAMGSRVKTINNGVAGRTLATMVQGANITADLALGSGSGRKVYAIQGGINDLIADASAGRGAALYAMMQTYCAAIRAAGHKVVCATMISNYSYAAGSPYDTERQSFNTLLRAGYSTFSDGLVDYAADDVYAEREASQDASYWADATHPNDTGYAVMARIATDVLLPMSLDVAGQIAAQYATDQAAVAAASDDIDGDAIILEQVGTGMTAAAVQTAIETALGATPVTLTADYDSAKTAASQASVNALAAAPVTIVSPVATNTSFEIVAGDDVSLPWSRTWTEAAPTAELRLVSLASYQASAQATADLTVACDVVVSDGTLTVTANLTAAQTAGLLTSPPAIRYSLMAQVVLTSATGEISTMVLATATVKRRV